MIVIFGISLIILLLFFLSGLPIASYLTSKLENDKFNQLSFLLSTSLIFGFFISAFSSTLAYGILGIDFYPHIFISLTIVSWLAYYWYKSKIHLSKRRIQSSKVDFSILAIMVWCLVLARGQWSSLTSPQLVTGDGPDTSQNLMTALASRNLGRNWFAQADNINSFFGNTSLRETVFDLYRYPSFRGQAGFDYLVFGTRWGLSIPYSQLLRLVGDQAILWETGVVLVVSLITLGILTYSISKIITDSVYLPIVGSLICVSNSLLLVQYFNGGLSQVWSIAGLLGLTMVMILTVGNKSLNLNVPQWCIGLIAIASWTILISTYVDAAIILALLIVVVSLIIFMKVPQVSKDLIRTSVVSGILTLLINPVLTYATILTFDLRLRAATGTGTDSKLWSFPSEIMGFVDVFSQTKVSRSFETTLLGILITISIIAVVIRKILSKQRDSVLGFLALGAIFTMFIGFLISYTGKLHTNYIYNKVAIYVTPLLVILWLNFLRKPRDENGRNLISSGKQTKDVKQVTKIGFLSTLLVISIIAVTSSYSATSSLKKQGTTIPNNFSNLLSDEEMQKELASYNYITPYILSANLLGVIADIHWISKAPNDIKLNSRLDNELRLVCYSVDSSCKPTTERIPDPALEKFGLIQYRSPITTKEFSKLSIRDRYKFGFEVFGTPAQEIPERFIGGNPYYK